MYCAFHVEPSLVPLTNYDSYLKLAAEHSGSPSLTFNPKFPVAPPLNQTVGNICTANDAPKMSLRKRLLSCIESHDSSKVPRMEGHPNVAAYYTAAGCYPAISQLLNHNISATISPVLTTSTISHAPNNFIERRSTQLVGTQHNPPYPVYVHCQKEALSLQHKQDASQFPLAFGFADQCNQSSVGLDTGQVCGVFPSCSIASKEVATVPLVTTCSGGVLLATQAPIQSGFGKTTATFTDPARMFQNFQSVDFPKMFSMHPSSVANLAPHMQQPHAQSFCQSTRDAPEQLLIHPMNTSPTTAVPRTVCQDASLPRIKWAWSDNAVSNCGPYANLPVISRVYSWGAVQNTASHVDEKQVDGNKLSHAHPTKEHPNIMFGHVLQQPQSGTRPGVKDIVQGSVRSTKHASTSSTGPVIRDVFSLSPELLLSEMVEKSAASSSHNLQQAFQHLRHGPKRGQTVSHVSESKPTGEASYVTKHGGGGGGGTKRGSNSHSVAQTSSRSAEIHEHASSTTKEMFLKNISIQTRLEEFARELQTLVSKSLCPFPSVARLERIFIPVSALQEKLFPGLSELVILNVFKCCKVVLRPATLREEKMLGAVCCSENTQETGSFTLFPFDKLKEVYPELLYCCWLEKMKKCIDQNNEATELEKNPVDSTENGGGDGAAEVTNELCERVCSSQDSLQEDRGATTKAQCLFVENPQTSPAGAEEEPSVGEAVGSDIAESAVVTNDSNPCEQTGPADENAERSRGAAVDSARSGSDANLECTPLIAPSPREDPHSTTTDVSSDSAATYPVISSSDVKDANVLLSSPPRYEPENSGTIQHSADDALCSIAVESENTIEENNKLLEVKRSKYVHGVKQRLHKRSSPRLLKESVGTDKHQQASDTFLSKNEVCKSEDKASKRRVPLLKLKGDMTTSIVMATPEDESQASKVKLATTEQTSGHPVVKRKTVPPLIIRSHHQAHEVRTRLKSPLRVARKEKTFSTSAGQLENKAVDTQEREFEALEVVRDTEVPFEETAFDDVNPAMGSETKDQKHVRDPLTEEASPGCGRVKRPRLKHLRASSQVAEKKLKKQTPALRRSLRQKTSGIQLRSQRGASSERRLVQVVPGKKSRCKRKGDRSEISPKLSRGRQRACGNADGGKREEPPSDKKTGGDLYPDLVGRRVLHLYDDEDTERWYQGVVTQLYEEHDDPLEAIYVVTYDSEPGWQYYLELLQDYRKGWLKLVD
ncbi:unnamed protein product [Lampetra planeri]